MYIVTWFMTEKLLGSVEWGDFLNKQSVLEEKSES
jgi:hypothetical protein